MVNGKRQHFITQGTENGGTTMGGIQQKGLASPIGRNFHRHRPKNEPTEKATADGRLREQTLLSGEVFFAYIFRLLISRLLFRNFRLHIAYILPTLTGWRTHAHAHTHTASAYAYTHYNTRGDFCAICIIRANDFLCKFHKFCKSVQKSVDNDKRR